MKVLILAAGFGTRLEKDLKNDTSNQFGHLINLPKPLLPVGKTPLISHWMKILSSVQEVDDVYLIMNGSNRDQFECWKIDWPRVKLLCDNSMTNETRTGTIGCIELAIRYFGIVDNLTVIAGDTLFYEDFNIKDLFSKFFQKLTTVANASLILFTNCSDDDVKNHGIIEVDPNDSRVTSFLEKPLPSETDSRKQCPCFYILSADSLSTVGEFLAKHQNDSLQIRDAPGHFIKYLCTRLPVYAEELSGRFDVGSLESYIKCHEYFLSHS